MYIYFGDVILRSLIIITTLFILIRVMGKKQITHLTYFDYVVGISIGAIAGSIVVDKKPLLNGIAAMIIWTLFPLILAFISEKTINGRRFLDGVPAILIQNGKIIEKNLKKAKLTINDLMEELRVKDIFNIKDVEFAILETSGRFSVLKKPGLAAATRSDLNLSTEYHGLCANVIIDGIIMKKNLELMFLSEKWLRDELRKNNIDSPEQVLLACCYINGKLYIDLKNQDPVEENVLI